MKELDITWKKFGYNLMIDVVAGTLVAIGIYNFAANAVFPVAGVTGIALMAYQLFDLPIGWVILILNLPIVIACYKSLGKRFFFRSAQTLLITSLIIDYVAPLFPVYTGDRMLAALCTAAFAGFGYAIIFMNGSSSAGVDFISLAIRTRKPHLSLGKIILILDVLVILIGSWVYNDIDGTIYGLLISFVVTTIIDKIMYGLDLGKVTLIVTDDGNRIAKIINESAGRGSTLIKGKGSYTGIDKDIVLCACNSRQMYQIKKVVKKADPASFTVIMESSEVVGLGFKEE
ncbi:MAG: YitT family protein [Lachnospiraceae bacterium]|nr:YitT family protein [Lachnospiraceae bacterium]